MREGRKRERRETERGKEMRRKRGGHRRRQKRRTRKTEKVKTVEKREEESREGPKKSKRTLGKSHRWGTMSSSNSKLDSQGTREGRWSMATTSRSGSSRTRMLGRWKSDAQLYTGYGLKGLV